MRCRGLGATVCLVVEVGYGTLAPSAPSHPRTLAPSHPRTLAPSHPRTLAPSHPRTLRPLHQRLDAVGNFLRRLAELRDGPVRRIAFCDVIRARVVDQPLGQRRDSISSRSATVMKQFRSPWNQNLAPPVSLMRL